MANQFVNLHRWVRESFTNHEIFALSGMMYSRRDEDITDAEEAVTYIAQGHFALLDAGQPLSEEERFDSLATYLNGQLFN